MASREQHQSNRRMFLSIFMVATRAGANPTGGWPAAFTPVDTMKPARRNLSFLRVAGEVDGTSDAASSRGSKLEEDSKIEPWVLRAVTFESLDASTEPQLLSDFLMEIGAASTSITDHDRGTDLEQPLFGEPDPGEEYAVVWGDAAVGKNVWKRCDVTAHFPATFDIPAVADMVRTTFNLPTVPRYRVDNVPDRDWVLHVQSSWKPGVCSQFILRFPWHTDEDVMEAISAAEAGQIHVKDALQTTTYKELQLEGGIAFGTGEHPTTQLCLGWIRDVVENHDAKKILDYGAGSGVLGLAACALSDEVTAVGVEIDADAIQIANANAEVNTLPMRSYLPPPRLLREGDSESASVIMKAAMRSDEVVALPAELDGPMYDACAANILAGPLVRLAATISSLLRPGGLIGLSGILENQAEEVVEAYSEYFSDVRVAESKDGWVLITGTRGVACPIEVG